MKITGIFLVLALAVGGVACDKTKSADAAPASGAKSRVVAVSVDGKGFTPARIELAKGEDATLRFTRTTDATCAKKVVFPDIHLEKDLPLDQPVDLRVPTDTSRELAFQCGMGMYKSAVVVR